MFDAIETRVLPATNTRGTRLVATTAGGHRLTVPMRFDVDVLHNHQRAAVALARQLEWSGRLWHAYTRRGIVWCREFGNSIDIDLFQEV